MQYFIFRRDEEKKIVKIIGFKTVWLISTIITLVIISVSVVRADIVPDGDEFALDNDDISVEIGGVYSAMNNNGRVVVATTNDMVGLIRSKAYIYIFEDYNKFMKIDVAKDIDNDMDESKDINDRGIEGIAIDKDNYFALLRNNPFSVQRFDPNGNKMSESLIESDGYQIENPRIVMNKNGDFLVVWNTYHVDEKIKKIYAKIFGKDGQAKRGYFPISQVNIDVTLSAAINGSGRFIVAWTTYDKKVFARLFDYDGYPIDEEDIQVSTDDLNLFYAQRDPAVAMNDEGSFVVTWRRDYGLSADQQVIAQIFDKDSIKKGGEFRVTEEDHYQYFPTVSMDKSGGFIISWWAVFPISVTREISAQQFYSDGQRAGGVITVSQKNVRNVFIPYHFSMNKDKVFFLYTYNYPKTINMSGKLSPREQVFGHFYNNVLFIDMF